MPAAEQPPPPTPEALSTPELCLAWRRSYLALLDVTSSPARCKIVRLRQCLLDELERRDPDGFTRWLDTGARAGSDPGRYLSATDRVTPQAGARPIERGSMVRSGGRC